MDEVPASPAADPSVPHAPPTVTTSETFQINGAKLYVPLVTLSIDENITFLEHFEKYLQEQFLRINIDVKKQHKP